jgi:ppGpp synthetase/RelA/SpoT-type nucleotidyltranferase
MADLGTEGILDQFRRRCAEYESFRQELDRLINNLLRGMRISSITSRLKEAASMQAKIDSKPGKYRNLDDVTDLVGVRIITLFSDDVVRIAMIIRRELNVDPWDSIDKRDFVDPKEFGYASLHYVVGLDESRLRLREYKQFKGLKAELQIRTALQHAWAEIEHGLLYKPGEPSVAVHSEVRRRLARISAVLELSDQEFDQIRRRDVELKARPLPLVRASGLAEAISEIEFELSRQELAEKLGPLDRDLYLSINVNVTSQLTHQTGREVAVELRCCKGRFKGKLLGANTIVFQDVFPLATSEAKEHFRVRGIRVNAFQLGTSSSLVPTTIHAGLWLKRDDLTVPLGETFAIAQIKPALEFFVQVVQPKISCSEGANSAALEKRDWQSLNPAFFLKFREIFPGAFKSWDEELCQIRYLCLACLPPCCAPC